MGRGSAKVCPHCYKVLHRCTCLDAAPLQPEDDLDPHIQMIMMAYHHRETHKAFIDALAARELMRIMQNAPSPYSPAVQPFVRALVQHSKQQLLEPASLTLAPPPLARRATAMHERPAGAAAIQAAFVHKQHLAAYHILPELTTGLAAYIDSWRKATAPIKQHVGTSESFHTFLSAATLLTQRVFLDPQFWSGVRDGVGTVTSAPRDQRGVLVPSPYFPAFGTRPSQRGSPNGTNPWLDRFLHARTQFRHAVERVVNNPYVVNATFPPHTQPVPQPADFPPQLVAELTALKFEFAALFALCVCPLTLPVHDFSSDGRDRDSKWFAAGGGFRLWTSETAHERLSDPHGLQASLRGFNELRYVGRTLADLPGAFPDVEARINTTLARLRDKQVSALALTISDAKTSPFRDPDERHPDLDAAFYSTIARLQDSTRSANHDPVRVAQSTHARAAERTRALANLVNHRPDEWYNGYLTSGALVRAGALQATLAAEIQRAARPASGRFELLEDTETQTQQREAREDSRLRDNLDADEDVLEAVKAMSADADRPGMSQDDVLQAVKAISALALVPASEDDTLTGSSSRAAGAAKRARKDDFDRDAPDYDARMRAVTPEQVLKHSFNQNHVVAALAVRGVKLPGIKVSERKEMLIILLMQMSPDIRIAMFAERGFVLRDLRNGQWNCWVARK